MSFSNGEIIGVFFNLFTITYNYAVTEMNDAIGHAGNVGVMGNHRSPARIEELLENLCHSLRTTPSIIFTAKKPSRSFFHAARFT